MSSLQISPKPIPSICPVPASKSYANRALVLAAISKTPTRLIDLPDSEDVKAMLECLKVLGVKITQQGNEHIIHGGYPTCEPELPEIHLYAGQGGTTARFLTALVGLGKQSTVIDVDEQLKRRPIAPLVQSMRDLGVEVTNLEGDSYPILIKGPYRAQRFANVDCGQSTQFASALMMVAPLAGVNLELVNRQFSLPYLQMTSTLMEEFKDTYRIPADFSSASYVIAWATFHQEILIPNITNWDHAQADSKLLEVLQKFGGNFTLSEEGLRIYPSKLRPFDVNVESCPDLVPTLAYLALFTAGESKLRHVKVLRYKESDRLSAIQKILESFGAVSEYSSVQDSLVIRGEQKLKVPDRLELPYDHRMVMMATLIAKHLGGGTIPQVDAVKKSFPNFFEIF